MPLRVRKKVRIGPAGLASLLELKIVKEQLSPLFSPYYVGVSFSGRQANYGKAPEQFALAPVFFLFPTPQPLTTPNYCFFPFSV